MSEPSTPHPVPAPKKAAGAPRPRKPCSDRKHASNQRNSLHSTGPITPEGKVTSARNSLKHGLCARAVDVPGEDPGTFRARFDARAAELNPRGHAHADYVVAILDRKAGRLDRIHGAQAARAALLARSATRHRAEARAREVEGLLGRLQEDCGTASRQLRLTTEGCEALFDEREHLKAPLLWPPHWDEKDAYRVVQLQGRGRVAREEAPHVTLVPTQWIERHRRTVEKLKANEFGETHDPQYRYYRDSDQDRDKADLPDIELGARHGVTWIRTMIEAEQRDLRERIEWLKESEAVDESEAVLRSQADTTEEGRLLHRYELEAERGFFKALAVLKGGMKGREKEMQVHIDEGLVPETPSGPPAEAEAPAAPNEAKAEGSTDRVMPIRATDGEGFSFLDIAVGRPTDHPDRE